MIMVSSESYKFLKKKKKKKKKKKEIQMKNQIGGQCLMVYLFL